MSVDLLERLLHEVSDLKHRLANMIVLGPVTDRDPVKGYRFQTGLDRDGNPVKSPWLSHPDSGGENSDWRPLSIGQLVAGLNPSGDPEQGFLVRAGFGGGNKPPSGDLDELVLHDGGGVRIAVKGSALTVTVGGVTWSLSGAGQRQTGGSVEHDGVDIGKNHRHGETQPGGGESGKPVGG